MSAAEGQQQQDKGDPNPNRLMARILDKVDGELYKHGLEFRHDDEAWDDYVEELAALIFRFYDDKTGGDSSYAPGDSRNNSESSLEYESDDEESTSCTLDSSGSEDGTAPNAVNPHKRAKK